MSARRRPRAAIAVAGILAVGASCSTVPPAGREGRAELERKRVRLEGLRSELDGGGWRNSALLSEYLQEFGLPEENAEARLLERGGKRLFLLRLRAPRAAAAGTGGAAAAAGEEAAVGRVLIVHGYMAHSGHFGETARAIVASGRDAVLLDLPGFGLSEGRRNAIDDFGEYGEAVDAAVAALLAEDAAAPIAAVGHSTGAAALVDFSRRFPERAAAVDRLALAAPLVRLTAWGLKRAGAKAAGERTVPFPRVPLMSRGTIRNPEHRRFVLADPLYATVFDPSWMTSLERWEADIGDGTPGNWTGRVLILQGEEDDVVDRKHNLPVLARIFPGADARLFPGLSHTILQEEPLLLEPVLDALVSFLR